jgi:hypothetical protein
MMCDTYDYHKTAVFATNDDMGTKSSMESGDGTYCEISKLSTSTVRFDLGLSDGKVDLTQWDSEIENALYGGARVFLLFMHPETAARLLVRGYDKGLFREGTQIFMSKVALTPVLTETVNNITMSKEKTKAVLKGIIGISFAPAFNWRYPAGFTRPNVPEQDPYNLMPKEAHEFIDAFKSLPSTAGTLDATTGLMLGAHPQKFAVAWSDAAHTDGQVYFTRNFATGEPEETPCGTVHVDGDDASFTGQCGLADLYTHEYTDAAAPFEAHELIHL